LDRPNLALALGVSATRARLERLGRQARAALDRLSGPRWAHLRRFHEQRFETSLRGASVALVAA
jgi:hypothetical protein